MPLPRAFFARPTPLVAQELLGKVLSHHTDEGDCSGIIVETEAYLSEGDPSAHSHRGLTPRNQAMFGPPGHAYVYFTYGMHFCFNVVTREKGIGEAVLIRALQPLTGIDLMKARRKMDNPKLLASGPARLCQALAIGREQNGCDLTQVPLTIEEHTVAPFEMIVTTRIGISVAQDLPLRYYIKDNPYVSKK